MKDADQIAKLEAENARLEQLLQAHGIDSRTRKVQPMDNGAPSTSSPLTTVQKIALFRELFMGRPDLFAVRWESASGGRSGYAPACANEWRPGVCQKPRIKCSDCEHREFVPLSNAAIYAHLTGEQTIGAYPLRPDNTCCFLAIDFDSGSWQHDALAYFQSCEILGAPAALEISRSGQGAHIWIFFDTQIPASEARQLGTALISYTCARIGQLELDSYDRLFPSQDVMPKGGFGNLIALPLQKLRRDQNCTVFVDQKWCPYSDQWTYLQGLKRLSLDEVRSLTGTASGGGHPLDVSFIDEEDDAKPWQRRAIEPLDQLPASIDVTMANQLYFKKSQLPAALVNRLIRLAAFQNPAFYKAQALRLSVWDKPRVIGCAQNYPNHLALPRGCFDAAKRLLQEHKVNCEIIDERCRGEPIEVRFLGQLRAEQNAALSALQCHEIGVLSAPTGFGKTVTAAALIARRNVNTLIVLHRSDLLRQWREQLQSLLAVGASTIGSMGGGRTQRTGKIDIALVQSLVRHGEIDSIVGQYGQVIVDECHHVGAVSFEAVLNRIRARYVLGLTATPFRRDGHQPIIFMQCGPIRFTAKDQNSDLQQREVRIHLFDAKIKLDQGASIQEVFRQLAQDDLRTAAIGQEAVQAFDAGRKVLVLTERTDHLEAIEKALERRSQPYFALHGRLTIKRRRDVLQKLEALPSETPRILLATGRLIGEGFDHAPLDTLVLAMPVSWKGTLQQYVGRLHRIDASKTDLRIVDIVDIGHPALRRMWLRRQTGYKAMGYRIDEETRPKQGSLLSHIG